MSGSLHRELRHKIYESTSVICSCPLVLPRPDGQEREGPLTPNEGPVTKGLQPFTTPGRDRSSDSAVGGRMQAPAVPPHPICRLGKGAAEFWQLVLKGATGVAWPLSMSCVSDHLGESCGPLFETGLTGYLDVIIALRKGSQALTGWTVPAKDLSDLLHSIAKSQSSPYLSDRSFVIMYNV